MRYNYPTCHTGSPPHFCWLVAIDLPPLRSLSPPRTAPSHTPIRTPIPPPILPHAADLGTRIGIHRYRRPAPGRVAHGPAFATRAETTGYGGVLRVLHARLARCRVMTVRYIQMYLRDALAGAAGLEARRSWASQFAILGRQGRYRWWRRGRRRAIAVTGGDDAVERLRRACGAPAPGVCVLALAERRVVLHCR